VCVLCIVIYFVFNSCVGPFTAALKHGDELRCRRAGGVSGSKRVWKKGHIPLKIMLMSGKGWAGVLCYHPVSRPLLPSPSNQPPATPRIYTSTLNRKRNAWVFLSTFGRHRHLYQACMRRNSCFILSSLTKLHRSHHHHVMDSDALVLPPLLHPTTSSFQPYRKYFTRPPCPLTSLLQLPPPNLHYIS